MIANLLLVLLAGCCNSLLTYSLELTMSDGACSGTAVGRNLILTAEHCFRDGTLVAIDGKKVEVLERVSDGQDHTLVRVSMTFNRWAARGAEPVQGQKLRWMGHPGRLSDVYREGYVTKVDAEAIYIDGLSYRGDSGAGLFDSRGRVVGVLMGAVVMGAGDFYTLQMTVAKPLAFTSSQWADVAQ